MIKLIVGKKGSGKTKTLIESIEKAVAESAGKVVCIEKGDTLTYSLTHKVRLIDTENYSISCYETFYGFIAGITAGNYDITEIFIDSILKIGGRDFDKLGEFLDKINALSDNIEFVFTISASEEELPNAVKKYL